MRLVKQIIARSGLLTHLHKLNIHRRFGMMQYPSFDAALNQSLSKNEDYFRHATIALAVRRILADGIAGSFAEAGVFRGDTSKLIHRMAPDRPYYLFDTFEGFPAQDLEPGNSNDTRFSDTAVERVLANIGDTRNIIVRKGYVPATLAGLEQERFAFVLLDLDLYAPTASSLAFFYSRLEPGGYLMVHDYNNSESNWACRRAVDEFMTDKPEKIVEIADQWGTVFFRRAAQPTAAVTA